MQASAVAAERGGGEGHGFGSVGTVSSIDGAAVIRGAVVRQRACLDRGIATVFYGAAAISLVMAQHRIANRQRA